MKSFFVFCCVFSPQIVSSSWCLTKLTSVSNRDQRLIVPTSIFNAWIDKFNNIKHPTKIIVIISLTCHHFYCWNGAHARLVLSATDIALWCMMTSSNGNIFRVTGPLCGEFTSPGEFPTQRPVTRSFDVFFDPCLNKRLGKHSWGWWLEPPSCPLWRQSKSMCQLWANLRLLAVLMTS